MSEKKEKLLEVKDLKQYFPVSTGWCKEGDFQVFYFQ